MGKKKTNKNQSPVGITRDFVKRLKDITTQNMSFEQDIIPKFMSALTDNNYHVVKEEGKSKYVNILLDFDEQIIMNFRLSDHLPKLKNLLFQNKNCIPSNAPFAQMCLLFLGKSNFRRKNCDALKMSKERRIITIDDIEFAKRLKAYFQENMTFPYNIYHYIPDLMTDEDLNNIINNSLVWMKGDGTVEYNNPVTSKAFEAVYRCDAEIQIKNDALTESIEREEINTSSHIKSFDIGDISFANSSGRIMFTINVKLKLKICPDKDVDLWKLYFGLIKPEELGLPFDDSDIEDDSSSKKKTY